MSHETDLISSEVMLMLNELWVVTQQCRGMKGPPADGKLYGGHEKQAGSTVQERTDLREPKSVHR